MKYIAETVSSKYYREKEGNIIMYRKSDNKEFPVDEINQNELISDCLERRITKLSPIFVYDYMEILKENGIILIETDGN